jgi:hypothetical protein
VGSGKDVEVVVVELAEERDEPSPLQDGVARGIGDDLLLDPVPPLRTGVGEAKGGGSLPPDYRFNRSTHGGSTVLVKGLHSSTTSLG